MFNCVSYPFSSARRNGYNPQTSITTGVAAFVKRIHSADVFALLGAGVAIAGNTAHTGANVGLATTAGALAVYPLGKSRVSLLVPLRIIHTSLGGTQYVAGFGISWGR